MKIKKFNENSQPLDNNILYPSEDVSQIERLRNYLTPFFTYFKLKNDDRFKNEEFIVKIEKQCHDLLPYIDYWLKIELNYDDIENELTENCESVVSEDKIYIKLDDVVDYIKELKVKK